MMDIAGRLTKPPVPPFALCPRANLECDHSGPGLTDRKQLTNDVIPGNAVASMGDIETVLVKRINKRARAVNAPGIGRAPHIAPMLVIHPEEVGDEVSCFDHQHHPP